jgi:hypothetical protein
MTQYYGTPPTNATASMSRYYATPAASMIAGRQPTGAGAA